MIIDMICGCAIGVCAMGLVVIIFPDVPPFLLTVFTASVVSAVVVLRADRRRRNRP